MTRGRYRPYTPPPQTVALNEMQAASDARLGCERMHERTEALFVRMARRDRTSVLQAALTAHFGADALRRAA